MRATVKFCTTLLALVLGTTAIAQDIPKNAPEVPPAPNSPAEDARRPRIGLVLGGGSALGLTEIGVLEWFEEHHIPVDVIAGTSMGCMLSALYATGNSPDDLKKIVASDEIFGRVFKFSADYNTLNYRRREDDRRVPGAISLGLKHGVSLPKSGLLTDIDLNAFLNEEFLAYGDDQNFNNLPIPLRCVATDLAKGELHVFRSGSLTQAVRASISLPGVFPAVQTDDHLFVDGALLQNLPAETEKAELKPDVMIAVSIPLDKLPKDTVASLFGVLGRSFSVASWANEQRSRKLADVVISPQVTNFTAADYGKAIELAKIGYETTDRMKDQLLKYRISDEEWAAYEARRHSLVPTKPTTIRVATVTGPTPRIQQDIQRDVSKLNGQPLQASVINQQLQEIRSDRRYTAAYSASRASGDAVEDIHITVKDRPAGPPYLLLGLNIMAQSGGVAGRATLEGTYLHQDFGGYRSELRGHFAVGFLTDIDLEYYRRLTASGWFVAPRFTFLHTPVYIYQNQETLADRRSQDVGGGLDGGYTFSRYSEVRFGWKGFQEKWTTKTGSDGMPDFSGFTQLAGVNYLYDHQDRPMIPQRGLRVKASAEYLYNVPQGDSAPRIVVASSYFFPVGRKNSLSLGAEGGTMANHNVASPYLFTLGGPMRLAASAKEEYRGTDYWLIKPVYLRRIAAVPAPLNAAVYIFGAYEAGQMRSPFANTITRQDAYFGITADTPLGALSFGPAFGTDDRRKLVFTLGRFF